MGFRFEQKCWTSSTIKFSDLSDWAKDEAVLDYEAAHRRSVEVRVFEALLLACDWFVSPYDLPIETIFTGDWLNFYISIALDMLYPCVSGKL